MKDKNILEAKLDRLFQSYYASELKDAKSDYPYPAGRQPVNGGIFTSRRNRIINFAFPALLAVFSVICLSSYRSPTPLGEAINRFYISNDLDKKIPQAVRFLADRVQFTEP